MLFGVYINRWWYKLAEKNQLEVLNTKETIFESPILRPETRNGRGDTGLLDYLLKHVLGGAMRGVGLTIRMKVYHTACCIKEL